MAWITAIIIAAAVFTFASAVFNIIGAFQTPKPGTISFGYSGSTGGSPRYGSFILDNTISNELPVPVLYGKLKIAGNVIWQTEPAESIKRVIALCEGQIKDISDVRANDIAISELTPISITQVLLADGSTASLVATTMAGADANKASTYTAYLGTTTQKADPRVPENIRPVMELHNTAYIAMTLQASEKLRGGNPTITSVCQGLLVEIFQNGAWGTTKQFSRNPAACIRDFITNTRYGLGISKSNIDEASFGSVYDHCEELVPKTEGGYGPYTGSLIAWLQLDGVNGSTSFPDSSPAAKTMSAIGIPTISTSQFKFGGASLKLDVGDAITSNAHSSFILNDSEITMECFVRFASTPTNNSKILSIGDKDKNIRIRIEEGKFRLKVNRNGGKVTIDGTTSVSTNTWYHVRAIRIGSIFRLFVNGVQEGGDGNWEGKLDTNSSRARLHVGRGDESESPQFDGFIDMVRVYKGAAVTTSDFDSPGNTEARYRLDYIIDSLRPAQDVLNDMLATFMGFIVYSGNKIKLRAERIDPITQYFGDGSTTKANATFDPSNIVRDSFSWSMSSVDDRPNRVKVQWVDPDQKYVKVYTQVEDRIDQDDRGTIVIKEISLLGITRASQASRMAKLNMAISKYAHVTIEFSARLESVHCEVGDVVAVTHQSARFTRKLFRITNMQEAEDETIRFTCREYNPTLYDDQQGTSIVQYVQPAGPNLYAPLSDVTGLTLTEDNFKNKDGVFVTNILASWTAVPSDEILRLQSYLIQISTDGGATYRDVAQASPQKTDYRIVMGAVENGTTFTVRVKTVSDRGAESEGATADITMVGKGTPPSDVEDFDVEFLNDHLHMTWSAINDADVFGYEIRVGGATSTWETAAIVITEYQGTVFNLFSVTRGTKRFFIKAIDNSGNYSANADTDSITISQVPGMNLVANFDLFSRVSSNFRHPLFGSINKETNLNAQSNTAVIIGHGNAAQMNGATQFIRVPNHSDFGISGSADFTIQCFALFTSLGTFRPIASHGLGNVDKWQFIWRNDTSALQFFAQVSGSTTVDVSATWTPTLNVWYKLLLAKIGTSYQFYIDGVSIGSPTSSGALPAPSSDIHIGHHQFNAGAKHYFHGRLDEFVFTPGYGNNAGDATLQTDAKGRKKPYALISQDRLYLKFDETDGFTAFDSSGYSHHGIWNTDPNWQCGTVGKIQEELGVTPATHFDPTYFRPTIEPLEDFDFETIEQNGWTYQFVQADSRFTWGRERYITRAGTWTTEVIDLGATIPGNFYMDLRSYSTSNLGFIGVEISTSTDNITFTAFKTYVDGNYTARYVKFRFTLQVITTSYFTLEKIRLVSARLVVDAPDIRQNFLNQSVSAGGRTFYLTGFYSVKSIVMTVVGSSNLIPRITSQAALPNSFDAQLFDTSGVGQAGNVNMVVDGY